MRFRHSSTIAIFFLLSTTACTRVIEVAPSVSRSDSVPSNSVPSAAETKGVDTIDCTREQFYLKHPAPCKAVIDPMKAKRGERAMIDCTGELEDGCAFGICEKVDLAEQASLRK